MRPAATRYFRPTASESEPTSGEMTTLSALLQEPARPNHAIISAESPLVSFSSRVTRDAVWNWCATPQKIQETRCWTIMRRSKGVRSSSDTSFCSVFCIALCSQLRLLRLRRELRSTPPAVLWRSAFVRSGR